MPEYPLEPDARAEIVTGSNEFPIYQQRLPDFYLKPEVPDIVKEHFRITKKILEHSYFVYEFIDVAFTQVIVGLEKALRLRYQELEEKDDEKLNFFQLTKWATERNLFELADQEVLDIYRKVRNGKVHEPKNSLGGTFYLDRIVEPIGFINDLYEDVNLRKVRKEMLTSLMKEVFDVFSEGATLSLGGKTFLVRNICTVFVNNKNTPFRYYFSMVILTQPQSHSASQLLLTDNLLAVDVEFNRNAGQLKGIEVTTNQAFTISALDVLGKTAMQHWKNQIDEIHRKQDDEHAMRVETLASFSIQASASKLYTKAVFDFYKGL